MNRGAVFLLGTPLEPLICNEQGFHLLYLSPLHIRLRCEGLKSRIDLRFVRDLNLLYLG